jgi:hypothetical protein
MSVVIVWVGAGGASKADLAFPLRVDPAWNLDQLDVAVFVQGNQTGVVHQAESLPWGPSRIPARRAHDPRERSPIPARTGMLWAVDRLASIRP